MQIPPIHGAGETSGLNPTSPIQGTTPAGADSVRRDGAEGARRAEPQDSVTVSLEARRLARAQAAASNADDVRGPLVQEISQRIADGTYDLDPTAIAWAMVQRGEA